MAFLQTPLRLWDRDLVKRGISDSVIMQIVDIYSIKVFKGIIKIHFQHLTEEGETVSSKVLQHENRIPSQFRTNHTRHTLLCKHTHTHTQTHAHTQSTCGKSQFPSDLGPHLTQGQKNQVISMELFSRAEGNLVHTA